MNGRDPEQFPRPFTVGYDAETEEYYIFAPEGCVLVNGMAAAINGADASGNVIIDEPADYLWAHVKKATSGEGYEVFFDGSDTMANSKWDFRVARFGEEENDGSQYDLATGVVNLGSSNEVNVDDKSIDWRTDRASQSAPEVKSLEIKGWKTQQSTENSLVTTLGLPAKAAESESEGGGESYPAPGSDKQIIIRNGVDGSLEYMDLGVADIIGGVVDVVGDGTLTINQGGSSLGTFTANQFSNATVDIPAPGDGTLTIVHGDATLGTFTANQSTASTITIPAAPTVNNGTLTIKQGSSTLGTFTANQATNTEVTIPAPVTPNDGVLSITVGNNSPVTFTANQATNTSVTIPEGVALTDTAPSDAVLSTGTASAGSATTAARADHVHKIPSTVKIKQPPVADPTASGTATAFIDSISQNENGEITVTKKTVEVPSAQVQSDWSETDNTKVDFIKNKPSLATVATSGSYNDLSNKPTIPAAQVQSDWNQSDSTAVDFIKNKPTIPAIPVSGTLTVVTDVQYDISLKQIQKKTVTITFTASGFTIGAESNWTMISNGQAIPLADIVTA